MFSKINIVWKILILSYSQSKKGKEKTPINSNPNYHAEMYFIQINMDYGPLQFDPIKFFLVVRPHCGSAANFNFFSL